MLFSTFPAHLTSINCLLIKVIKLNKLKHNASICTSYKRLNWCCKHRATYLVMMIVYPEIVIVSLNIYSINQMYITFCYLFIILACMSMISLALSQTHLQTIFPHAFSVFFCKVHSLSLMFRSLRSQYPSHAICTRSPRVPLTQFRLSLRFLSKTCRMRSKVMVIILHSPCI